MKKRITGMLLVLSMVLSFACPAGAVNADSTAADQTLLVSDLAKIDASIEIPEAETAGTLTQQEAAAFTLRRAGMQESQLGSYPADYNAIAKSAGIVGEDFNPEAPAPRKCWSRCGKTRRASSRRLRHRSRIS